MRKKAGAGDVAELLKARDAVVAELVAHPAWVLGSLVETAVKRKGKKVPFRYLSRSVEGRNRILYVSEAQMAAFGAAVGAGRRAVCQLEEISELNAQIIKAGGRA